MVLLKEKRLDGTTLGSTDGALDEYKDGIFERTTFEVSHGAPDGLFIGTDESITFSSTDVEVLGYTL